MISTPGNKKVIVDSDALIGLIHKKDALHDRCLTVSQYLAQNSFATIVPYPIVLVAATTLAKDKTIKRPDLAAQLLRDYATIDKNVNVDMDISELVAKLYQPKTSVKNTPFDYYVLALAKKNNIPYVFSFDSLYKKHGLTLVEELLG